MISYSRTWWFLVIDGVREQNQEYEFDETKDDQHIETNTNDNHTGHQCQDDK